MTKESITASSTSSPQASDAQRVFPLAVNVREAAKRLGVSRSAVYRLDREHGPIRFLSVKRPIAIDLASLEAQVANANSIEREPELTTDGLPCPCPHEAQAEQTEWGTSEMSMDTAQSAPPMRPMSPSSSCGQRDLRLIRRNGAAVITYLTYI